MSIVDGCVLRVCSGAKVRSGPLADGMDEAASAMVTSRVQLATMAIASDLVRCPVAAPGVLSAMVVASFCGDDRHLCVAGWMIEGSPLVREGARVAVRAPLCRVSPTCVARLPTTDQKVRGSSPFGRAADQGRDQRNRRLRP
jgi:hypothetical protein